MAANFAQLLTAFKSDESTPRPTAREQTPATNPDKSNGEAKK